MKISCYIRSAKPGSIQELQRILDRLCYDWLNAGDYPKMAELCSKSTSQFNNWLSAYLQWNVVGVDGQAEKSRFGSDLLRGVKFLKALVPFKPPGQLYRGLEVTKFPKPGQPTQYGTKDPWTSWTASQSIARTYGNVVVKVDYRELAGNALVFLWPPRGELAKFHEEAEGVANKEWGVLIKSPLSVTISKVR